MFRIIFILSLTLSAVTTFASKPVVPQYIHMASTRPSFDEETGETINPTPLTFKTSQEMALSHSPIEKIYFCDPTCISLDVPFSSTRIHFDSPRAARKFKALLEGRATYYVVYTDTVAQNGLFKGVYNISAQDVYVAEYGRTPLIRLPTALREVSSNEEASLPRKRFCKWF